MGPWYYICNMSSCKGPGIKVHPPFQCIPSRRSACLHVIPGALPAALCQHGSPCTLHTWAWHQYTPWYQGHGIPPYTQPHTQVADSTDCKIARKFTLHIVPPSNAAMKRLVLGTTIANVTLTVGLLVVVAVLP